MAEEAPQLKPKIIERQAIALLWDRYGLKVKKITPMCSYDDLNFHVTVEEDHVNPHLKTLWSPGYTLKVVNSLDTGKHKLLESFHEAMFHLKSRGLDVPVPVLNIHGEYCQRIHLSNATDQVKNGHSDPETENQEQNTNHLFAVYLLTFLPGKPLSGVKYTPEVLRSVGRTLAKVIHGFKDFSNPVLSERNSLWSLWSVPKLKQYVYAIRDPERRALVQGVIEKITDHLLPILKDYPQGLIHGDLNEHNLLVSTPKHLDLCDPPYVSGVIDFGDVHLAPRVFEIAVCLVYSMLGGEERLGDQLDPVLAPGHVLAGMESTVQLSSEEKKILKPCMEARLAQSLTLGAYSAHNDPGNDYVLDSARHGWTVLQRLVEFDDQDLLNKWNDIILQNQTLE